MDVEKRISRIERVAIRVGVLILVILTLLALVLDKLIWLLKTVFHALSS
jgi:hypothetical protein